MKNLIISQVLCAVLLAGIGDAIPSGLRIMEGKHAGEHQFPYMAALFVGQQCFCGGSIISHRHVLTAGHCTEFPPFVLSVRLGAHNLEERSEGEQRIDVEKIIQHPRYSYEPATMTTDDKVKNDISIVQLVQPIQFSPTVQPIRLPQPGFRGGNYGKMTLTGWGDTSLSHQTDPHLKKAEILESNNCDEGTNNVFCTSGDGTGYEGDSGSPVVVDGIQVGVVSLFVGGKLNVHTRVASYASWIQSEVESSGEEILYSE